MNDLIAYELDWFTLDDEKFGGSSVWWDETISKEVIEVLGIQDPSQIVLLNDINEEINIIDIFQYGIKINPYLTRAKIKVNGNIVETVLYQNASPVGVFLPLSIAENLFPMAK